MSSPLDDEAVSSVKAGGPGFEPGSLGSGPSHLPVSQIPQGDGAGRDRTCNAQRDRIYSPAGPPTVPRSAVVPALTGLEIQTALSERARVRTSPSAGRFMLSLLRVSV